MCPDAPCQPVPNGLQIHKVLQIVKQRLDFFEILVGVDDFSGR
jgi:hypothetical protein